MVFKRLNPLSFYENTSAITTTFNLVVHSKTKHIELRKNFIKGHFLKKDMQMEPVSKNHQLSVILTKPLLTLNFLILEI